MCKKMVLFTLIVFTFSTALHAEITSMSDGLWSNAGTWDTGVPGASDDVVITEANVQVDSTEQAANLDIKTTGTLSILSGGNLTLTSLDQLHDSGKLNIAGSLTVTGLHKSNRESTSFEMTAGTLSVDTAGWWQGHGHFDNSTNAITSITCNELDTGDRDNPFIFKFTAGSGGITPITVNGDVILQNKTSALNDPLEVDLTNYSGSGPLTIVTYTGTLTGGFIDLTITGSASSWELDTSTAGKIDIKQSATSVTDWRLY